MKVRINYLIYLVEDNHGNTDFAVVTDHEDEINITIELPESKTSSESGVAVCYDGEARFLEHWCFEQGFNYKMIQREDIVGEI